MGELIIPIEKVKKSRIKSSTGFNDTLNSINESNKKSEEYIFSLQIDRPEKG